MTDRTYLRTDRNGTKYYRCRNFQSQWTEKVYTPEYEAKLQARRAARRQEEQQQHEAWLATLPEEKRAAIVAEETKLAADLSALEAKAKAEREAFMAELAARRAISQYVGTVGSRDKFEVTLEELYYVDTAFGQMIIVKFRDAEQNVITWKTMSNSPSELSRGSSYTIRATIKEHKEYKGEKQTVVQRLSIL